MEDERTSEPVVEALHFEQHYSLTVDDWPQRTSLPEEWLNKKAHHYKAQRDGDTLIFALDNGEAVYKIRRDLPRDPSNGGIICDLVEGSSKVKLAAGKRKFTQRGEA